MPKRWSSKEVEKILGRNGFVLVSQKGSHKKYILGSKIVIVPANRDPLRQGTFLSILRQSGLEITDFF